MKPTDPTQFLIDLDAGTFSHKVARALSEAAAGTVDNKGDGEVTLTFKMKQIADSHQVTVSHDLKVSVPTLRGKRTENDTTSTLMHVGSGGRLSFFPENQLDMLDEKSQ